MGATRQSLASLRLALCEAELLTGEKGVRHNDPATNSIGAAGPYIRSRWTGRSGNPQIAVDAATRGVYQEATLVRSEHATLDYRKPAAERSRRPASRIGAADSVSAAEGASS